MMRLKFIVVIVIATTAIVSAQLVDRKKIPVPLNGDLAPELASVTHVSYRDEGPVHADESYLVKFACSDGRELTLLFPHPDVWTSEAQRDSKQPVIAILHMRDTQILAEVKPGSTLNQLILRLIKNDISKNEYDIKTLSRLEYTAKRVKDRQRHAFFDSSSGIERGAD